MDSIIDKRSFLNGGGGKRHIYLDVYCALGNFMSLEKKIWRCLIGENMLALLKLIAQRFTSGDTFKGTIIMVIAAMNTVNFSVYCYAMP